jgi:sulfur carrier protein
VNVTLNGEPVELVDEATVADAVRAAGVLGEARGVAVAIGGEVVPRGEWMQRELRAGESLEVVRAVQGG